MSSPHENRGTRRFGSQVRSRFGDTGWTRVRAIASLGMVFGLGAVGTMAAWSDTATATTGEFSVSSTQLKLTVNDARPAYAFTTLAATGLMPTDTTASSLTLKNTGQDGFVYRAAATASGDSAMAGFLTLSAHTGSGTSGSGNAKKCTGASIGSTTLQAGSAKPLITTARSLGTDASEAVCFQVTVADGVTKATAGKSASVAIQFTATEN